MPSLSAETLRAYVLLATGEDHPPGSIRYKSETGLKDSSGKEYIRFDFVRTYPDGHEDVLHYVVIDLAGHSVSHWEREFIDGAVVFVRDKYAEEKARFEKLTEVVACAGLD